MKLYHGSPTPITRFDIRKGTGRFGPGLYLTPSLDAAKFFAAGGRQGNAGQKLTKGGYIYEFEVNLDQHIFNVASLDTFLRDYIMELDSAQETFENWGDLVPVQKHVSEWALQEGYWGVNFSHTEGITLDPIAQVLIVDKRAIKSVKPFKEDMKVESATVNEMYPILKEFKDKIFSDYDFPIPEVKIVNNNQGYLGQAFQSIGFDRKLSKTVIGKTYIYIQKSVALGDLDQLRRVLAHELIHAWEYVFEEYHVQLREATSEMEARHLMKMLRMNSHGKDFVRWMNKFNSVYGKDFVTVTGDQGTEDGQDKSVRKEFYLFVRKENKDYSYGIMHSLNKGNKDKALQLIERGYKVFKSNDEDFLASKTINTGYTYQPNKPEKVEKLKELYDKEQQISLSAALVSASCDEQELQEFIKDFTIEFKQKVSTLNKIFHNYDKTNIDPTLIYQPFLIELKKLMLKKFGACDSVLKMEIEKINPSKYSFSNFYKPNAAQYKNSIENWINYYYKMVNVLCRKYDWLKEEQLLKAVDEMKELLLN